MDSRSKQVPKHTPGPWLALPYIGVGEFGDYAIVCDTRDRDIAAVEEEADAQLIAAAPEMLEALKAILKAEMSGYKAVEEWGGYVLDDDVREIAEAAVAKAEGRQP